MRSLAAYLIQRGLTAQIQPIQGIPEEAILASVLLARPKVVGFSLIFQRMLEQFANLIAYLRNNGVKAHFTIGGHFPSFSPEKILSSIPDLDSVVLHEGEETLLELTENVDKPEEWHHIRGLCFRAGQRLERTPARPLIADLDSLPFPIRRSQSEASRGIDFRSIAASRGCYYNCSFCSINAFYREPAGPARRSRSPRNVLDEMLSLHKRFDTRVFIFQDDDIFTQSPQHRKWLDTFLAGLSASGLGDKVLWRISCRIDDLHPEYLMRMREVGLATVYIGIESASDKELEAMNKGYRAQAVFAAVDLLTRLGVPYEFGFMLFTPDTSFGSIRDNIRFLRYIADQSSSLVHFCKMAPYSGTAVERRLRQEGRLIGSLSSPDYRLANPRLDLLHAFFSQTFNFRNFNDAGLVERLRFAKFDSLLLDRLFPGEFDTKEYSACISGLIRDCNEAALDTMEFAVEFAERNSEEILLSNWGILQSVMQREAAKEDQITRRLDLLMAEYGYGQQPLHAQSQDCC